MSRIPGTFALRCTTASARLGSQHITTLAGGQETGAGRALPRRLCARQPTKTHCAVCWDFATESRILRTWRRPCHRQEAPWPRRGSGGEDAARAGEKPYGNDDCRAEYLETLLA